MNLINIFLIAISAYMIFRIIKLSGRSKLNKKLLAVLDKFDDKDDFFSSADAFINENKDPEYVQKVSVLRLWGDTYYERDEEFKQHLAELNIDTLVNPDGKYKGFVNNEDSFFYLYMALPSRLNFRGRKDLRALLDEKLAAYDEVNGKTLLKTIHDENKKFYDRTDDLGKEFMRSLLDGEYGGYQYSKQLIGLYKHCEEAILAVLYKEEGDTERYDECIADVSDFAKNTRLGGRWLKELGLELPQEEPEEEADDEVKQIETAEVAEDAEAAETAEPVEAAEVVETAAEEAAEPAEAAEVVETVEEAVEEAKKESAE